MTQLICLIDSDPINDFPAKLGHHMKEIVDDTGLWAVVLHFQIHGGVHIHGNSLNALANGFAHPFEEWLY